jgi:hypothetical protein
VQLWLCVRVCMTDMTRQEALPPSQVPLVMYQMSATAFFTALVINLTSLLFEDSPNKRQLALLSCTIKGIACHSDLAMVAGCTTVLRDAHGALWVPPPNPCCLQSTPAALKHACIP